MQTYMNFSDAVSVFLSRFCPDYVGNPDAGIVPADFDMIVDRFTPDDDDGFVGFRPWHNGQAGTMPALVGVDRTGQEVDICTVYEPEFEPILLAPGYAGHYAQQQAGRSILQLLQGGQLSAPADLPIAELLAGLEDEDLETADEAWAVLINQVWQFNGFDAVVYVNPMFFDIFLIPLALGEALP